MPYPNMSFRVTNKVFPFQLSYIQVKHFKHVQHAVLTRCVLSLLLILLQSIMAIDEQMMDDQPRAP